MQHPFSKMNSVKSILSEDIFKRCGKQEIIATACAIENLFLSLTAYGLAGYLSTGGITYMEEAKLHFDLGPEDKLIGTFFIGYPEDLSNPLTKRTPIVDKVKWISE